MVDKVLGKDLNQFQYSQIGQDGQTKRHEMVQQDLTCIKFKLPTLLFWGYS